VWAGLRAKVWRSGAQPFFSSSGSFSMTIAIRDVAQHDLDAVLALNNQAGPGIIPIDKHRLRHLFELARYFKVAELDGVIAGFLVGMSPDAAYDSPNFNYFKQRFDDFFYIDRVVIANAFRRHGIGRVIYADVLSFAEIRYPRLTTEVFIEPRDDVSLVFFGTQDFSEVGQQVLSEARRVSLMVKPLKITYDFVRETYLQEAQRSLAELWPDRLNGNAALRRTA
jgi:hypothetical protein